MPKEKPKWYVIHTYSGYENNVKDSIQKIIENREMYDVITEVVVPVQKVYETTKTGKQKEIQRKIFPGYVFLKMIMNDDTWYVVRNTRGVTSFVGPGSKPVPLTEDEVISMGIESFLDTCDIEIGDLVLIKEGPFAKSSGVVKEVNANRKTVIVNVNFFGRETPVELDFHQVQQMG
ncbi:transcription termination/antitermination protein NusG [[Clostridium] colinum]|uniref:transcription termination/antitermination protein NusG n=1 Tax=[Clostridium] colinum TaxID=36835 RepID=UPI002025170A|nr:transcription termination/antitermination protein NusG [[Clostridium] colinum]